MKPPAVSLLLGVSVLLLSGLTVSAVSLKLSPNVQQFFSGDANISLSCVEDGQTGGGWTVKRTGGNQNEDCGAAGSGSTRFNSSFCVLDLLSSSGGTFFCEHTSGQRSDDVTIIVSGGPLIIEVPAHPVLTGSDVTLRCKHRDGSEVKAHFFRDDVKIGSGPKGEFTLHHVNQSDEGLYSCSTDSLSKCKQSRLRVKDPPPVTSAPLSTDSSSLPPPPPPPPPVSVVRLLCHLLVFSPYCVCTVLMVSICCSRKTGNKPAVSMEMTQHGGEYDDITADVTTVHDLRAE